MQGVLQIAVLLFLEQTMGKSMGKSMVKSMEIEFTNTKPREY